MNIQSFFHEELEKINENINQSIFTYRFPREIPLHELIKYCISEEIYYFESKEEDFKFLGVGNAREIAPSDIDSFLINNPDQHIVYQGMFEKDADPICYLPEWCFISKDNQTFLKVHYNELEDYLPMAQDHFDLLSWKEHYAKWTSYLETPRPEEWNEMINAANAAFLSKECEKIVLSRKKIYNYESIVDPKSFFFQSYNANLNSSHFSVFYQKNYNEAFISFTPERLFALKNNRIETISLAGSTQRGKTPEEDKLFEEELIHSPKLIHEHQIVTNYIKDKISPLVIDLETSNLFTMKLPYIQHRQALIGGELKSDVKLNELINSLHPTPAVGGLPLESAFKKILEIEKTKREFYAAATGVLSKDFSELCVGIRSAYIRNETVIVFGGAGIVQGSEAQSEWNETGAKMHPFTKFINKK